VASTTYFCRDRIAVGSRHRPDVVILVERGAIDPCVELDIGPQAKTVGNMAGVFQDFRLRRVALAPLPLLLQFVGERIGILHALDVAACPRIAVPVPGTADIAALLIDAHRQPQPAQPVKHVHAGKTGPDHHDVITLGRLAGH
jgi:hypothetical protein